MSFVSTKIIFSFALVAVLAQPLFSLNSDTRIESQNNKYQTLEKQNNVEVFGDSHNGQKVSPETSDEYSYEDEDRITLSEPYKFFLQTTARFAVARSSLTDYVTVDTFMDVVSDTAYALSKPSTLGKALKVAAITIVTLFLGTFVMPASLIQSLGTIFNNPDRLMKLEKHLPAGLNEMGIINLLNEKTDELLTRFRLNDSSCRRQTVCRSGELIRCTFPRLSKVLIKFISENFSRPKYRSNKYLNSFLSGFIDQNCSNNIEEEDSAQSKSCASNFIKSLSFCSPPKRSQPSSSTATTQKNAYQSIRALRA